MSQNYARACCASSTRAHEKTKIRARETDGDSDRQRQGQRESERLHVAALAAQRVAARRVARRDATHYASQGDACQALQRNALDFGAGA